MKPKNKVVFRVLAVAGILISIVIIEYLRQIPINVITKTLEAETNDSDELNLMIVGDVGSGTQQQRDVAYLMEAVCSRKSVDAVVLLGDNFIQEGVSGIDDPQWKTKFEDMYNSPCLKRIKFYSILGNHDYRGVPGAEIEYTKTQERWTMPARYYTVQFGDLLSIFAMDSTFPDRCGSDRYCSLDWFERHADRIKTKWRILVGHHPMMSGGKYPKPKPLQRYFIPSFYCNIGADFYFSGHDHNFQHLVGKYEDYPCEINHFVVGTGGSQLVDVKELPGITRFKAKEHGVLFVAVKENSLRVDFVKVGGFKSLYSYERIKQEID